MSWVSRQAGILIHQRDLRVGSLLEFYEFRLNQSSENSVELKWIPTEVPRSSYSKNSRQAGKSSGPQNLAYLSTLQRLNLESPWGGGGLNLAFITTSTEGSTVILKGGERWCPG
jgi:hypothetical protein